MTAIHSVILCGGSGTRLWPLSRRNYPKQLLSLYGDESLLQSTVRRSALLPNVTGQTLVCSEAYRFLIAEQIQQLGIDASLLLEPVGRNTAPAIAVAAFQVLEDDPILLVLPSDHVIADGEAFADAVESAASLAEEGHLVTFGVEATRAHTGYGYLKAGSALANGHHVDAFVEKPDSATAERYLSEGGYYWNSGMFVFKASTYLDALAGHEPVVHERSKAASADLTIDLDFTRIKLEHFEACPSISIDYAVMERTERAAAVPLSAGWSDIGSYDSLWEAVAKDSMGNVTIGDVISESSTNCYIRAESRLVATACVRDLVIVETPDAVLVADREQSERVKDIVEELDSRGRVEHMEHRRVYRPWGYYEGIDDGDRHQVKHLLVKPGCSLSLQKHHHRAEHWVVVKGTARVTKGEEVFDLSENESTYIPVCEVHRLENPGRIPLSIIEVQSGSYLGEDDIVRLKDVYGRT